MHFCVHKYCITQYKILCIMQQVHMNNTVTILQGTLCYIPQLSSMSFGCHVCWYVLFRQYTAFIAAQTSM